MQYMGGKFRLAKRIAKHLGDAPVLEPFMGGANLSVYLPTGSVCSDIDPSLATLYQYVQEHGVENLPEQLGKEDYDELRRLDNPSIPLTAFAKYGCSYAGKPWGGWAKPQPKRPNSEYAGWTKNALRKVAATTHKYETRSFFDLVPGSYPGFTLYLDPPYQGTTGYHLDFDYDRFVKHVWEWAATNPVFISEYTGQPTWELVEEFERAKNGLHIRDASQVKGHTEKLFRVNRGIRPVEGQPLYLTLDEDLV